MVATKKKHFQSMMATKKHLSGNQKHFGNDQKVWQLLGLVNLTQFGNQFFGFFGLVIELFWATSNKF